MGTTASLPRISLVAPCALARANLLGNGPFVTALPSSVLRLSTGGRSLKALPIHLQFRGNPLAVLTLKNRALNPLVARFIDHLLEVARSMLTRPRDGVGLAR
jgi:DNA-binding transcriptional LysR family regulator